MEMHAIQGWVYFCWTCLFLIINNSICYIYLFTLIKWFFSLQFFIMCWYWLWYIKYDMWQYAVAPCTIKNLLICLIINIFWIAISFIFWANISHLNLVFLVLVTKDKHQYFKIVAKSVPVLMLDTSQILGTPSFVLQFFQF